MSRGATRPAPDLRAVGSGLALLGVAAALIAGLPPDARATTGSAPARPDLSVHGACLYATGPGTGTPVGSSAAQQPGGGQVLYGVDEDAELPIASTTKLMTALVTLQHVHHLSEVFTQNDWYPAAVDSQIGLVPGERMSVHDLLLALLLPSADDAAEDLAYNVGGGSVSRFIAMMNAEAVALHLTRTHYSTPVGFDTPGNYSSPCDLDRLAAYDLQSSPYFARVVALPSAVLRSGRYVRHITNTLDLVGRVPWIEGVKTGTTPAAGYVAVAEGVRHGMTLIASVLGTSSEAARDANTLALLDYGFSAFRIAEPLHRDQVLARPLISGGDGRRAAVVASTSFSTIVAVSDRIQVQTRVPARLSGPLGWHEQVGEATVLVGRRVVARIPLELANRIGSPAGPERHRAAAAVGARTTAQLSSIGPSTLILLALAIGGGGMLAESRRRHVRAISGDGLESR